SLDTRPLWMFNPFGVVSVHDHDSASGKTSTRTTAGFGPMGHAVADLSEGTQPARFWCWQGNCPHSGLVCEGVGWSGEIAHSDRSVVSSGDNCFPGWTEERFPFSPTP